MKNTNKKSNYNVNRMIAKAATEGLKKRNLIQVENSMILRPEKPLSVWLKEANELYAREQKEVKAS